MKNFINILLFLIGIITFPSSLSQQQQQIQQPPSKNNNCATKHKCDECIRTFGCVWCAEIDYKEKRCTKASEAKCSPQYLMNPKIEHFAKIDKPLTVPGKKNTYSNYHQFTSSQENVVQVSPQYMQLKLRPNEGNAYRISMMYRQAVDYPVDLYYLMDLSHSMKDDKDKLSLLGNKLAETMSNITANFKLGFGSFVDKVVMPYVSIVPKKLQEPCDQCAAPYGFKNIMSLSSDTSTFSHQVNSADVSGNLDAPEGGFDAIMQAIVCREQIGWREKARKLLVFSTDSSFHYAGDGKLGGIITPNDGCCHLDHNGYYTYSTEQDYPSVSQINLKVKENSINIIFAVTSEQVTLYKQLQNHIEGSSCGVLSSDSSNVVDLVEEQYNKISSSIELREKNLGNYLRVKYYSKCLDINGPLRQTNKCDGLKVGQTVEFDIDIEMISCPPDRKDWKHTFYIYPVGVSENMTVDVEMMCDCDCQYPGRHPSYKENSEKCSFHGTLKCGLCDCDADYSGDDCNCTSDADKTDRCRPDNNSPICSDRGTCKCNTCFCNAYSPTEIFYGRYCECNNFSCPRTGGVLCSGHGDCVCGKCKCREGWIGDDCSCEDSISNCVAGSDNQICSGHGQCICNKCVCNTTGDFSGKYCNKCPTCTTLCEKLYPCVACSVHKLGPYTEEECSKCQNIEIVDTLVVTDDVIFCAYIIDECRFTYTYEQILNTVKIVAEKEKKCPTPTRIPAVVFSVISSIVLIGLAFLFVWKFYTSMQDRREFATFKNETETAKWNAHQNPIYKQATSTFKNPTYCENMNQSVKRNLL